MAAGTAPKKTRPAKATPAHADAPVAATRGPGSTRRLTVQTTVSLSPDMSESLTAFAQQQGINRSEAIRVFLEYGRTAAERWRGAAAPAKKARPPARAPRTAQRSA